MRTQFYTANSCRPGTLTRRLVLAVFLSFASLTMAGVKVGETFPDLATFKLEGKLPVLKDKIIMVDFWASWCDPCKDSFPAMAELQKQYGTNALVIIAINVDENKSDMEDFLKKTPAAFAVMRDGSQKLVEKTGIGTMPSSFLLDRTGKVRFAHNGFRGAETKKEYAKEIETLVKEKP